MSKKIDISTIGLTVVAETIRAALFKAGSIAVEQSITEAYPHNDRDWTFYGLEESVNYVFKIQKLVGAAWVDVPGFYFTFTTDSGKITYKAPVQIQVDNTTGFASGTNVAVFDGTGGKDDWRHYEIRPERIGSGTMKRGVDYSWDPETATWTLLITDDKFQPSEYYEVQFDLIISESGGGQVFNGKQFQLTFVKTEDYDIEAEDFGNKIIVKGDDACVRLTLPDVFTVPENKLLYIESGVGDHYSIILSTLNNSQYIDWLEGDRNDLYFGRCEQLAIYKEIIDELTHVYRVHQPDGNFKIVGRDFHSFSDVTEEINALPLDGGGEDGLSVESYPRLYNDHVLKLNPAKVCAFEDWATGQNKYKYSLANDDGFFHIPDTRNLFVRNTGASRDVGIYQDDQIKETTVNIRQGDSFTGPVGGGPPPPVGRGGNNQNDIPITFGTGTETNPTNISFNHFVHS